MSIPAKCKAAVCEKAGEKLKIQEIDVPEPGQGEVLIKVHACGVCHSDLGAIEGRYGPATKWPCIPGHETVGTIVKLGPGVTRWHEGDLVGGAWHGGHDGTCRSCERAFHQTCDNKLINGVSRLGGYAEYTTLRQEAAVKLPTDMEKSQMAPLLCAGVTVFNGIRQMKIVAGGVVAVQGLGGLGHLALQYSRKLGYRTVALSSSDSKREFATQLGATDFVDGSKEDTVAALNKLGGADLILVTAPNPKLITPLTAALAPGGKILMLSAVGEVAINTAHLIGKGASLHGWPSGHSIDSQEAISFAQLQGVKVMTETFKLDEVNEALEHMNAGKVRFRGVLIMD